MLEALSIIQDLEPDTPFLLLNSNSEINNGPANYYSKDWILAVGEERRLIASEIEVDEIDRFLKGKWWFGYLKTNQNQAFISKAELDCIWCCF